MSTTSKAGYITVRMRSWYYIYCRIYADLVLQQSRTKFLTETCEETQKTNTRTIGQRNRDLVYKRL
jgi:hypothetical protein